VSEIVAIGLPQLVLWYDSSRIQTWPSLVAKADPNALVASPTDFGRWHITDRMTDDRHAAAEKITRNLPGLERKGDQLILRGIGLLEATERGYRLSESGKELGAAYRADPHGREWVRILARLLLTREPRTRTLIGLMSEEDVKLHFTAGEWWGGSLQRAAMHFSNGRKIAPFARAAQPLPNLRSAMTERAWWALGAWRAHSLVNGADDCRFVGQLRDDFSLHDISLALRASCEVFVHLNVLRHRGDQCWLDHDQAIEECGADLASDFGWRANSPLRPLVETLAELIPLLRTDTGFIVASELRSRMREHGVENPDRAIARLEAAGQLVIEATDYGHSRHGVGLYQDPSKQLIKLRIY
jgi:hypothetical protein